jgi:hypothetical protein
VVLAGWLGRGQHAAAQSSPHVEARVSVDSVKVGERFAVRLVAEHGADVDAVFPTAEAGPSLFGDLHVVQRGAVQRSRTSATRRVDSVAYEVTTFALDTARVPILPVRLVAGPDTTVVGTAPQVVPVRSVVEPDDEVLRTPAALASFPWPLWAWGALILSALALAGGGVYAWRRSGEKEVASESGDAPPTPYRDAMERLQKLERRNPVGRAACKAFYVDLADTLRVYLSRRAGVRALEQTTPELLAALRRRPEVQGVVLRRLQTVLEQADLVKFADAQPPPEESQSVLEDARSVVDALESAQRRAESSSADDKPAPA